MRLYTFQLVARMDDDGNPDYSVSIDVEDGADVLLKYMPETLRGVADQVEQRLKTGDVNISYRS